MPLDNTQRRYNTVMAQLRKLYRIAERMERNATERYSRALYNVETEIADLESVADSIVR